MFSMLWAEAIAGDADLQPIFTERDAEFRAALARSIRLGIDDGTISAALDPDAIAMALVGTLRGIGLQLVLIEASADFASLRRTVMHILDTGLT